MARLANLGAETGATVSEGCTHRWGTAETFATGTVRSGLRSWSFSPGGSAGDSAARVGFTGATGTDYWFDGWIYVTANPSTLFSLVVATDGAGTAFAGLRLDTNGTLILRDVNGGANVGSPSAAVTLNDWNRISLRVRTGAGAVDQLEGYLGGVSFASATGASLSDNAPGFFEFGGQGTMPASYVVLFDDVIVNDSTGGSENALPAVDHKLVLLLPTAQNSVTASTWQKPGGAVTNMHTSVDNIPPNGVANSTNAAQAENMIRNAVSNAAADVVFAMTDYLTAGVGASDTVNLVQAFAITGCGSTAVTKTGSLQIASNPAGSETNFGAYGTGVTAGTFPTAWQQRRDPVIYAPAPTLGTAPTLELGQRVANTTIALVCQVGIYVDYTPSSVTNKTGSNGAGTGADAVSGADRAASNGAGTGADSSALGASYAGTDAATASAETSTLVTITPIVGTPDTGAGADASTLVASLPVTNPATGADVSTLAAAIAGTVDTATGAETSQAASPVTTTDAGTGAEASTETAALTSAGDTGASTDVVGVLDLGGTPIGPAHDVGAGDEGTTIVDAGAPDENATGVDAVRSRAVSAADSATGADAAARRFDGIETGVGAEGDSTIDAGTPDEVGLADDVVSGRSFGVSDTATGADSSTVGTGSDPFNYLIVQQTFPVTVETSTVLADVSGQEAASGADVAAQATAQAATESGSGSDVAALASPIVVTESGAGVDSSSRDAVSPGDQGGADDVSAIAASYPLAEAGAAAEAATLSLAYAVTDTAAGVDVSAEIVALVVTDAGAGVDVSAAAALVASAGESGAGVDSINTLGLSGSEAGAGSEAAQAAVTLPVVDAGALSGELSAQIASVGATDGSGAGVDVSALSVGVVGSDAALGASETVSSGRQGSPDGGAGSEGAPGVEAQAVTSDLGSGSDASAPAFVILARSDASTGAELSLSGAAIFDDDAGLVDETGSVVPSFIPLAAGVRGRVTLRALTAPTRARRSARVAVE